MSGNFSRNYPYARRPFATRRYKIMPVLKNKWVRLAGSRSDDDPAKPT